MAEAVEHEVNGPGHRIGPRLGPFGLDVFQEAAVVRKGHLGVARLILEDVAFAREEGEALGFAADLESMEEIEGVLAVFVDVGEEVPACGAKSADAVRYGVVAIFEVAMVDLLADQVLACLAEDVTVGDGVPRDRGEFGDEEFLVRGEGRLEVADVGRVIPVPGKVGDIRFEDLAIKSRDAGPIGIGPVRLEGEAAVEVDLELVIGAQGVHIDLDPAGIGAGDLEQGLVDGHRVGGHRDVARGHAEAHLVDPVVPSRDLVALRVLDGEPGEGVAVINRGFHDVDGITLPEEVVGSAILGEFGGRVVALEGDGVAKDALVIDVEVNVWHREGVTAFRIFVDPDAAFRGSGGVEADEFDEMLRCFKGDVQGDEFPRHDGRGGAHGQTGAPFDRVDDDGMFGKLFVGGRGRFRQGRLALRGRRTGRFARGIDGRSEGRSR